MHNAIQHTPGTVAAWAASVTLLLSAWPAVALADAKTELRGSGQGRSGAHRLTLDLDAGVAYGGYAIIGSGGSGMGYSGSLSMLWKKSAAAGIGFRISGTYSPALDVDASNWNPAGVSGGHYQTQRSAIWLDAAFLAAYEPHRFLHVWAAAGAGVNSTAGDDSHLFGAGSTFTFPEAYLAAGYKLPICRWLALQLSAEAGWSGIMVRGAVQAGLAARF